MITLLGAVLGFFGSAFPDMLKFFRDREDRAHELAVLQLQLKQQAEGGAQRLEEIRVANNATEIQALYATYHSGVGWVDALNGTVRPVVAYAFFVLYALIKLLAYAALISPLGDASVPFGITYATLWTEEDAAIFAGIISFYFGQRAMGKLRR